MNPVAVLYGWFNENKEYLLSSCSELEFKDSGRGSACVNLETEAHIVSVCAWDHARCLDIQIMEVKSEEVSFLHMGDCASIEEFKGHLKYFSNWLKGEPAENA